MQKRVLSPLDEPGSWRNGRRSGLKIRRANPHPGSSPGESILDCVAQLVEQVAFNL